MKQTIAFRLDDDLVAWLDELAQETRTNRTGVLVQMILRSKQEREDGAHRETDQQTKET